MHTAIMCAANKLNANSDNLDGCEVVCPVVAGGSCNMCFDAKEILNGGWDFFKVCFAVKFFLCWQSQLLAWLMATDGLVTHAPTRTCAQPSWALPTNAKLTVTTRTDVKQCAPTQKSCTSVTCTANKFDMNSAMPQMDVKTAALALWVACVTCGLSQVSFFVELFNFLSDNKKKKSFWLVRFLLFLLKILLSYILYIIYCTVHIHMHFLHLILHLAHTDDCHVHTSVHAY